MGARLHSPSGSSLREPYEAAVGLSDTVYHLPSCPGEPGFPFFIVPSLLDEDGGALPVDGALGPDLTLITLTLRRWLCPSS